MAVWTLRIGFVLLGVSALMIAGSNIVFGVAVTASLFDALFQALGLPASDTGDLATANVDSEFRFYSVFWASYGVVLLDTARRLPDRLPLAGLLILLFFLGGIGRALSMLFVGLPATLFTILTILEFGLSAILVIPWLVLRRAYRS